MALKEKKRRYIMGAVIGDVIGSVFEFNNVKTTDFPLFSQGTTFTDDSVLTLATMFSILFDSEYDHAYQIFARNYPNRGYGGSFGEWISSDDPRPYNSWGNGSAMRVSPVGWAYDNIEDVLENAKLSAEVTHNHPEGIKGAQAVAAAVFLARKHKSKDEIKDFISVHLGYDLDRSISEIRKDYRFDVSCQGSVPEAIIAFLESKDFEDAIRLAISLGGDSDTIACITGSIAEAFYGFIPEYITDNTLRVLPKELINIIEAFSMEYCKFTYM